MDYKKGLPFPVILLYNMKSVIQVSAMLILSKKKALCI